ncbi:hypothetical protein [Paenibacillus agricola]|uniref:hypothetical protein n=1 Tax=Paenibacillus agricola TaxID=2716264 RepID=UPI001A9D48EF|nr:hypothetical protein [Paenibacillus agricola]
MNKLLRNWVVLRGGILMLFWSAILNWKHAASDVSFILWRQWLIGSNDWTYDGTRCRHPRNVRYASRQYY